MKKVTIAVLSIFLYATAFSQTDPGNFAKMSDFLPPAPNAAAIIKNGELTLNKNTGSPSVNIPLYVLKGTKLSVNVSLNYSSTGIKVDEIASRAGMGWSLNAGGVVTRTQRGNPDEQCTRITPPYEPVQQNCGSFNFMNNASTNISYDAEPDLFNFNMNGISGSFVLDGSMQPMQIPAGRYKIEKDFNGTGWNFKITTTDGIAYYFGGAGAVELTKRETSCGKSHSAYLANAWYLSKIVHPSGETITFQYTPITYTYDNGVNQSLEWVNPQLDCGLGGSYGVSCPGGGAPYTYTNCINKVNTQGVLLSMISNESGAIGFSYQARTDCGDKLVSSINQSVKQNNISTLQSTFNFTYNEQAANMSYADETTTGYNKTPYLTSIQETSPDNQFTKTHYFSYNDPAGRPPRLSFSQDHWGYFNGKINQGSFIPLPDDILLKQHFPTATANREPDPFYASKGMLTKIIYPTGGIDNIEYEGNQVQEAGSSYRAYHEFNCYVQGTGSTDVSKISSFTIDNAHQVMLVINSIGEGTYEEIHNFSTVEVNGPNGNVLTEVFRPSQGTCTRYLNPTWPLPAGNYTLTIKARGAAITTNVTMKYYPKTMPAANTNKIVGGVRVKRLFTGNPGETPMIKRYYYADISDLNTSSLAEVQKPKYSKDFQRSVNCSITTGNNSGPWRCHYNCTAMYSGSLTNLFDYHSGGVSYSSVIESIGDNFEGGGTQSKFYTGPDARGQVIWGVDIPNAPLSNFSSITNGNLREEIILKKLANGALAPIKKTAYDYVVDSRANREIFGYSVNNAYQLYAFPGNNCPPSNTTITDDQMGAFDMVKYSIISYWAPLKTITATLYDENGQNPVTAVTNNYYDNTSHLQLTRRETLNSKGQLIKDSMAYPHNYTGNSVYDGMIGKNIISPVIDTRSQVGGLVTSEQKINYGIYNGSYYWPQTVQSAVKGNALETEGTFDLYDNNGNVLQLTDKSGIVTAILWGYGNKYPVAQVKGSTYANAIAQLSVSVTALQTMDGSALRTELNRIRINLPVTRVVTYTYKPGAGVASITDADNKTNTYEYDSFNRLLVIKDQDGNAIKKNEYVYATPNANATNAIYFNQPLTRYLQCQSCAAGFSGSSVTYTVPYGKYFSLISQADADAKAWLDTDGQESANKSGTCFGNCK